MNWQTAVDRAQAKRLWDFRRRFDRDLGAARPNHIKSDVEVRSGDPARGGAAAAIGVPGSLAIENALEETPQKSCYSVAALDRRLPCLPLGRGGGPLTVTGSIAAEWLTGQGIILRKSSLRGGPLFRQHTHCFVRNDE